MTFFVWIFFQPARKGTGIVDLVIIGGIDTTNLLDLTTKTERTIERIRP